MNREKLHTKGPWKVEGIIEFFPLTVNDGGDLIAQAFHSDHDGEDNITMEQCEANAHLIASAPCLLDVLESVCGKCMGDLTLQQNEGRSNESIDRQCKACKVSNVIAKAYGEQS